jgi:hypothetical protein
VCTTVSLIRTYRHAQQMMGVGPQDVVERTSTYDVWVTRRRFVSRIHALLDASTEDQVTWFTATNFGADHDEHVKSRSSAYLRMITVEHAKAQVPLLLALQDSQPQPGQRRTFSLICSQGTCLPSVAPSIDLRNRSRTCILEHSCAVPRFF